ncbi:MAG: RluA family pseudouridine synthase [Proteobacteria bacterium]|nr:RluA family pseudouridine synthase [Pseudomonadota bacterium]
MEIKREKVSDQEDNVRLDSWLRRNASYTFAMSAKLARKGQIRVDGKRIKSSTRIFSGQEIKFLEFDIKKEKYVPQAFIEQITETIIEINDDFIAFNKPCGIATQGGTKINISLDDALKYLKFDSEDTPRLVHRIDKETSGILIVARNLKAAKQISELFKKREISKSYIALAQRTPKLKSGIINATIQKKHTEDVFLDAKTRYEVLDYLKESASLIQFTPETGRMHQIRIHAAHINCPIIGDLKYGKEDDICKFLNIENRLYLHAHKMIFELNGKTFDIKADLPKHFKDALHKLGLACNVRHII